MNELDRKILKKHTCRFNNSDCECFIEGWKQSHLETLERIEKAKNYCPMCLETAIDELKKQNKFLTPRKNEG